MIAAQVCHDSGSRLRLRFSGLSDDRLFNELVERISDHEAVRAIKLNPRTGSVVIWLHGDMEGVRDQLAQDLSFEINDVAGPTRLPIGPEFLAGFKSLRHGMNIILRRLSRDHIDLVTLFIALLMWAAYKQWRSKQFLPAGFTLLILIYKMLQEDKAAA